MKAPKDLRYSREHEWVKITGDKAVVGITEYAAESLGEIVFAELPETGVRVSEGDSIGSVESVKSVSEIYTPVGGKIVEVNPALEDTPEKINEDPYGGGWILKLDSVEESGELMDAEEYKDYVG